MAPLHKVIAEITMLRCYGNKGCVILKIARDMRGRKLACVKHGLLLGKDGANQLQPPFTTPFPEEPCRSHWLNYQMSLFAEGKAISICADSLLHHIVSPPHTAAPTSLSKVLHLACVYALPLK